jgi:hypothetical protein
VHAWCPEVRGPAAQPQQLNPWRSMAARASAHAVCIAGDAAALRASTACRLPDQEAAAPRAQLFAGGRCKSSGCRGAGCSGKRRWRCRDSACGWHDQNACSAGYKINTMVVRVLGHPAKSAHYAQHADQHVHALNRCVAAVGSDVDAPCKVATYHGHQSPCEGQAVWMELSGAVFVCS